MYFDISQFPKLNVKIAHRNWKTALAEAFALILVAEPGEVICITGPSRIGKSRLIRELMALLCGDNDYRKTGLMPAISVRATNGGTNGTFSTKDFAQRLLNAIDHPLLSNESRDIEDLFLYHKTDRTTEASMKSAFERALVNRKTKYLFIDEAQHASYAATANKAPYAVMDSWKCLAEATGVVLVVVGAYPVLNILGNSPHIVGRKKQVEFPRYRLENGDEYAFCEVVDSFGSLLNLDQSIERLSQCAELLYEGSFGCIGLLKSWLAHASVMSQLEGLPITRNTLAKTMKSDYDRKAIWDEIEMGEKFLETSTLYEPNFKKRQKVERSNLKPKTKPFRRKPTRHPAGNRT